MMPFSHSEEVDEAVSQFVTGLGLVPIGDR
jgi:hypothetical protein